MTHFYHVLLLIDTAIHTNIGNVGDNTIIQETLQSPEFGLFAEISSQLL